MRTSALAAALVTLAFAAPLTAQAGTKTHDHQKIVGYSVNASWDYLQGNVGTHVAVIATQNDLTGTAGPAVDAFIALAIDQYDTETGNVLLTGVAYVFGPENFEFTIDKDMNTATLVAHNAIFEDDNSFTFFNVDLALTWTATGEASMMKSNDNYKDPAIKIVSHFHGLFRDGVASGSIFGKNTQFTPIPSSMGQLQFNRFGSMTITTTTP